MKPDPPIDAIREVRHRISASVDHDPRRLVERYQDLEKQYQQRLVSRRSLKSDCERASAAEQTDAVEP